MDLSTATPVEIDTALLAASNARVRAEQDAYRAERTIDRINSCAGYEKSLKWNSPTAMAEAIKAYDLAVYTVREMSREIDAFDAEFDNRGGWTRYYLVLNSNGHVHSSTHCSSCFPTTSYAWLTDQSGMTAEALVELAGESACTDCFPWAPVNTLRRHSVLEAPERKAARLEREAKKAAKDAKALKDGITNPDGTPVDSGESYGDRVFKTERSAEIAAVSGLADDAAYDFTHPSRDKWLATAERVIVALAFKHGTTVEVERARIEAKAAKKIAKNAKEAAAWQVRYGR